MRRATCNCNKTPSPVSPAIFFGGFYFWNGITNKNDKHAKPKLLFFFFAEFFFFLVSLSVVGVFVCNIWLIAGGGCSLPCRASEVWKRAVAEFVLQLSASFVFRVAKVPPGGRYRYTNLRRAFGGCSNTSSSVVLERTDRYRFFSVPFLCHRAWNCEARGIRSFLLAARGCCRFSSG